MSVYFKNPVTYFPPWAQSLMSIGQPDADERASQQTAQPNAPIQQQEAAGLTISPLRPCPDGFAYIPEGTFVMGSEDGEADERPVRTVFLDDYCIAKAETPVYEWQSHHMVTPTFGILVTPCDDDLARIDEHREYFEQDNDDFVQWYGLVGNDPISLTNASAYYLDENICWNGEYQLRNDKFWGAVLMPHGEVWGPYYNVSWDEADAYCKKIGGRLPTEAQWEKAARGPRGFKYGTWSGQLNPGEVSVFRGRKEAAAAHRYPPNGYGLYDMAGDVAEWTHDWYAPAYAAMSPQNPQGPESGATKVIRGGSFFTYHPYEFFSATFRDHVRTDFRTKYIGFRCVLPPQHSKNTQPSDSICR